MLVVDKHSHMRLRKRHFLERHRSNQQAMIDERVKQNWHCQEISNEPSKHAIGFSNQVEMHTRILRQFPNKQHRRIKQTQVFNVWYLRIKYVSITSAALTSWGFTGAQRWRSWCCSSLKFQNEVALHFHSQGHPMCRWMDKAWDNI